MGRRGGPGGGGEMRSSLCKKGNATRMLVMTKEKKNLCRSLGGGLGWVVGRGGGYVDMAVPLDQKKCLRQGAFDPAQMYTIQPQRPRSDGGVLGGSDVVGKETEEEEED